VNRPDLSVVIPLYNEEDNLEELHRRLTGSLGRLNIAYELIFVNDGSRDETPCLMQCTGTTHVWA